MEISITILHTHQTILLNLYIEVHIHSVYIHVHVDVSADLRSGVLRMFQKVLWPVSVDPVDLSHHSRRGHKLGQSTGDGIKRRSTTSRASGIVTDNHTHHEQDRY